MTTPNEQTSSEADPETKVCIDRLRRDMLTAGVPSEHAAIATGLAADYAITAYAQGHSRGFNQGVEWQREKETRMLK